MKDKIAIKTFVIDIFRRQILPSSINWCSKRQLEKLEKEIEKVNETYIGCDVIEHIKGDHHSMAFHTKIDDITIIAFRSDWSKEINNKNLMALLDEFGPLIKLSKKEIKIFQLDT